MKIIKRNTGDILGGASVRHANHWLLYSCVVMPHATLSLNYIKPIFDEIVKRHTHTLHYSSIEHDSKIFSWYSTVTREHCYSTREKNASSVFSFDVFLSFFFCQFQTGRSLYSRCWFTFIGRICSQVHSYILVRVRVIIAYSTAHRIALIL